MAPSSAEGRAEPGHVQHHADGDEARQRQRPVHLDEPVELVEADQGEGQHDEEVESPPWTTRTTASTASTAPVMMRVVTTRACAAVRPAAGAPAEAPLAAGVLGQRLVERRLVEVRPQLVAEVQLGVGALPEQEVADAQLARGADQQLGVVHLRGVQVTAEGSAPSPLPRAAASRRGRVQQLPAAAVVEGDVQRHPRVGCGERFGLLDAAHQLLRYAVTAPDEAHARPALVHVGHLRIYHLDEQVHERRHLFGRAAPVLGGERVHRHLEDPEVERVLEDAAQRLRAGPVACRHGQPPALRPAAVAVHDDGDVARGRAARRRLGGAARAAQTPARQPGTPRSHRLPQSSVPPRRSVRPRGSPLPCA